MTFQHASGMRSNHNWDPQKIWKFNEFLGYRSLIFRLKTWNEPKAQFSLHFFTKETINPDMVIYI